MDLSILLFHFYFSDSLSIPIELGVRFLIMNKRDFPNPEIVIKAVGKQPNAFMLCFSLTMKALLFDHFVDYT